MAKAVRNIAIEEHPIRTAIVSTVLTMAGVYVVFFLMIGLRGAEDALTEFYRSQASMGGLYVNALAIVAITYGKCSTVELVRARTYFLSVISLIVVVNIFAQALYMQYLELPLMAHWLREEWVSWVLQGILVLMVFVLSCQKEVEYKRKKIR